MFGFAERARLAMYEGTLRQAKTDASAGGMAHVGSLALGIRGLGEAVEKFPWHGKLQLRGTLGETIASLPSGVLSGVDLVLLNFLQPRLSGTNRTKYEMLALINGLVFVRIVEVARPSLTARAHTLRDATLHFAEPLFRMALEIAAGEAAAEATTSGPVSANELAAASMATLGLFDRHADGPDSIIEVWCAAEMELRNIANISFDRSAGGSLFRAIDTMHEAQAQFVAEVLRGTIASLDARGARGFAIGTALVLRLVEMRLFLLLNPSEDRERKIESADHDIRHRLLFVQRLIKQETGEAA